MSEFHKLPVQNVINANFTAANTLNPVSILPHSETAADFFKAISHSGRLQILVSLIDGEKSVGTLESMLGWRQAAVSQQLSRLREDGLVSCRRDGKIIYYRLGDPRVVQILGLVQQLFVQEC